jgi:uncharacterized FlaG/YvyC family protein
MDQEQKKQLADGLRKKTDELNDLVKQAEESGLDVLIKYLHHSLRQNAQSIIVKIIEKTEY